jgi:uncharacterized repeat protein (TIGR01451 family)
VHARALFTPPAKITIAKCPASGPANCVKSVNGSPVDTQAVDRGNAAAFRVTVRNTGGVTLTNVTVTDPLAPGCNKSLGTMAAGSSKTYTCSRPDVNDEFTNTANVVGTPPTGAKVTDSDVSNVTVKTVPFIPPPTVSIAKCPIDTDNPCIKRQAGDPKDQQTLNVVRSGSTNEVLQSGTAKFRITVTNTGAETLNNVKVTDPLTTGCNRSLGSLAPGKSKTYTCTRNGVTAAYLNTSKVVGTGATSHKTATDQDVSEVIITPQFTG